jgi:cobyrinic acid a,c-diamide synthase
VYLARTLTIGDSRYPMAGLFPLDLTMHRRPVGHGYTAVRVDRENPFFATGTMLPGHEFHYTGPAGGLDSVTSCMIVERGTGLAAHRDGLIFRNTLACYTHIHAEGVTSWAPSLVSRAREYREGLIPPLARGMMSAGHLPPPSRGRVRVGKIEQPGID